MESDKEEDSKSHFVKEIKYSKEEPWRSDVIFGQKEFLSHGHLALSGSKLWYLRDGDGTEIIVNGKVLN